MLLLYRLFLFLEHFLSTAVVYFFNLVSSNLISSLKHIFPCGKISLFSHMEMLESCIKDRHVKVDVHCGRCNLWPKKTFKTSLEDNYAAFALSQVWWNEFGACAFIAERSNLGHESSCSAFTVGFLLVSVVSMCNNVTLLHWFSSNLSWVSSLLTPESHQDSVCHATLFSCAPNSTAQAHNCSY